MFWAAGIITSFLSFSWMDHALAEYFLPLQLIEKAKMSAQFGSSVKPKNSMIQD